MSYVTRFAPSPTSDTGMHLGNARTGFYSWLAARASGGKFILRIDDTDNARNCDSSFIFDAMSWLGLDYDAVYRQSDRGDIYAIALGHLLDADMAVADDGAIRLRLPADLPTTWTDSIKGQINISDHDRKLIDGLVLIRSDGSPTYHFASVVDDFDMGINYIIRGIDHLGNAPKHVALRHALIASGFVPTVPITDDILYAHVGLIEIMKDDGTGKLKRGKMSKRDDAASLLKYRDAGYDPSALLDYMMRIGWAHTEHDYQKRVPFIDRDEALAVFLAKGKMRAAPSLFDPAMLAKSDRRVKAAAGVKHYGKGVVA